MMPSHPTDQSGAPNRRRKGPSSCRLDALHEAGVAPPHAPLAVGRELAGSC